MSPQINEVRQYEVKQRQEEQRKAHVKAVNRVKEYRVVRL